MHHRRRQSAGWIWRNRHCRSLSFGRAKAESYIGFGVSSLVIGTFSGVVGCTLLTDFEAGLDRETGALLCSNGLDDDLDGQLDCLDPSCLCNACGNGTFATSPSRDELGRACTLNCECRRNALAVDEVAVPSICNPVDGASDGPSRCLEVDRLDLEGRPQVDENTFLVSFVVEQDRQGNSEVLTQRQNVFGLARYEGDVFSFSSARWSLGGRKLEFRSSDSSQVLEVVLNAREPTVSDVYRINDGLDPVEDDALRAQLGPISSGTSAGVNQIAVVRTSTLGLEINTDGSFATGAWRGAFRAAGAVDRARGGRCLEEGKVYHPAPQRCFPGPEDEATMFFAFGCPVGSRAPEGSGSVGFYWSDNPFSSFEAGVALFGGECAVRILNDEIEIRLRTSPLLSGRFILRARIPRSTVASGTSVRLGSESVRAEIFRTNAAGAILEVSLGDAPDIRLSDGQIFLEEARLDGAARLLGWLEGQP